MKELEERIMKEGRILPGDILKVDSFLNHQVDADFMRQIGEEFHRLFADENVTKILTIEASGIAPALMSALAFHVPCIYAKKNGAHNIGGDLYTAIVHSYTYGKDYTIAVSRPYLTKEDRVLIIDDFMANGKAAEGLIQIVHQAGASLAGIGICIEKGFQDGGKQLRGQGIHVESLAIIDEMHDGTLTFHHEGE